MTKTSSSGRGLATAAVAGAIAEMKNGFHQSAGMQTFYIEAIVGEENVASRRVAERTISNNPTAITDQESGLPAFQYVLRSDG